MTKSATCVRLVVVSGRVDDLHIAITDRLCVKLTNIKFSLVPLAKTSIGAFDINLQSVVGTPKAFVA